jgi:Spy/CpxP family protein refolding chaperone
VSAFLYGFLGVVAALFLIGLARRRRWRRMARLGGPPRFLLRGLFRRLGTRPEQEAVLGGEADALAAELRALREAGRGLQEEVAALLEAPALDRAAVEALLGERMARLEALRHRAAEAVARVHGALDEGQRRTLAELMRRGGHRRHAHGCR